MEPIKSEQNPIVKYIQKLKKRRFREQEGRFMIEGMRLVEEALVSGWPVESLLYTPPLLVSEKGKALMARAQEQEIKTVPIDKKILDRLACTEAPQGILALCRVKDWSIEEVLGLDGNGKAQKNSLVVLVDGVNDPGNLGTILRSADAFGAGGVLLTTGAVDIFNDKTLRSSMGSIFHLPIIQDVNIADLPGQIHRGEVNMLVGVPRGGKGLDSLELDGPTLLVLGNEAEGPSTDIFSLPHQKVTIPMPGNAESLNVAVAASIMLYQIACLKKGSCCDKR